MKIEYYILGLLIVLVVLVARQNALLSEIHQSVDDVSTYGDKIVTYVEAGAFDKVLR